MAYEFSDSEETALLRQTVRTFAETEIAPRARELDEKEEFSLELTRGMGQLGLFGTLVDPAYGGHGYAAEAVSAVLDHGFDVLGVRRVTAGCFADNAASVRILEKLGMRREQHGVQDSWHAELGWVDGATYALLADERPLQLAERTITGTSDGDHGATRSMTD